MKDNKAINLTKGMKILLFLQMLTSLTIVILASIQFLGYWDNAINIFEPLVAVLLIIQGLYSLLSKKKVLAIFSFVVALFIISVAIFIFCIK